MGTFKSRCLLFGVLLCGSAGTGVAATALARPAGDAARSSRATHRQHPRAGGSRAHHRAHRRHRLHSTSSVAASGAASGQAPSRSAPGGSAGGAAGTLAGGVIAPQAPVTPPANGAQPESKPPETKSPETKPPESKPPESPLAESSSRSSNPFSGRTFYVDPASHAAQTESEWAAQGRTAEAAEIGKIAGQPTAEWFGNWSYGHGSTAADVSWWVGRVRAAGALPVLVAYNMPWRDCNQYSSGGAASPSAYEQFIEGVVNGIAGRPAVVILEPDALPELSCLTAERQAIYYNLLSFAVRHLSSSAATAVYLDAGNAGWQPAATMAARLRQADVAGARGFSLNVSNFDGTASEVAYGEAISRGLGGGVHFIVDTSRNGRGPAPGGAWCNPPGRGLGARPTSSTGAALADAYFWVKRPGESDGTCNGGPSAGEWWPSYALELAQNAAF
jgi:endoglucanase